MEGVRKELQSVLHLIYTHAPNLSEQTIDLLRNLVNGEFDGIFVRSSFNANDNIQGDCTVVDTQQYQAVVSCLCEFTIG